MGVRFLTALAIVFSLTLAVLGGAGYAVTRLAVPAPRELFRAAPFDFELAHGWWCELEGTEYVCNPPGKPPYSAIAIIAMKERSDDDNLAAYRRHLEKPQPAGAAEKGTATMSQVRHVERRIIAGHEWVEALHAGSEIPNYDTYYLGTTTSHIGILVTMSVHKDHAAKYIAELRDMMGTLNIYQR
jgi:hypothetical protein